MLQVRLKEGNDKRWYNPSRDMVYMWPKCLRKALESFDNFEGEPGCTREQMISVAVGLGQLVTKIIKEPIDHEACQVELRAIEASYPVAFAKVSTRAIHVLMGVYTAWVADAKPKVEGDAEIPVIGLDQIAEKLARGAK